MKGFWMTVDIYSLYYRQDNGNHTNIDISFIVSVTFFAPWNPKKWILENVSISISISVASSFI